MVDASPGQARAARGFAGYAPDLEPEVLAFQQEVYPARRPDLILPNWRWMFVASASRLGLQPLVWMYRRDGRVVAHQGAIAVAVKLGAGRRTTGWFVETVAANSVRGSPIGPMVIKKALEDLPCNLSLGQTEQMRQLQFAMGWHDVRRLPAYLLVLRPAFDLRKSLPPVLAEVASVSLAALHRGLAFWQRLRSRGDWTLAIVKRFGDSHDALWRDMAAEVGCAVIRDAAYLNWKYVDRPASPFVCLEIRRAGQLAGVAVVVLREPGDSYTYRRGVIVDLVVRPGDRAAVRRLLCEAVAELRRRGAASVVCLLAHDGLEQGLRRFGFLPRAPHHHFLVATGGCSEDEQRLLRDPAAWYLTAGDSDLDLYAG